MKRLITSESVTEGHPDKVCDRISDAVLDELLAQDPLSRVACETCVTTGFVLVMGEVTTNGYADVEKVARRAIKEIGYTDSSLGFDYQSCSVMTMIHAQSEDIALGVDKSFEQKLGADDEKNEIGAGDQGMMYGFACRETDALMPLPIHLAHGLSRRLSDARKQQELPFLRPDGKTQVTVEYEDGVAKRIDTVVVSTQHSPDVTLSTLQEAVMEEIVKRVLDKNLLDKNTKYYINPTGQFIKGGPCGDSGLTGRKIIADTYGGYCPHGGGAFSGKDATKVDRSAAYMTRYAAKNIVAAGLAEKCEIQVSYAIGVAKPVSLYVNTFGTGKLADDCLTELALRVFDFRPRAIIEQLGLRRPIFTPTSSYGHFGREEFAWEKLDMVDKLLSETMKA